MIYSLTTMKSEQKVTTLDITPNFYKDKIEISGVAIKESVIPVNGCYLNFLFQDGLKFTTSFELEENTFGQFIPHPIFKDMIFIMNEVFYEDKGCRVITDWWDDGYVGNRLSKIAPPMLIKNQDDEIFQLHAGRVNVLPSNNTYEIKGFSTDFELKTNIKYFKGGVESSNTFTLSKEAEVISAGQGIYNIYVGVCGIHVPMVIDYLVQGR